MGLLMLPFMLPISLLGLVGLDVQAGTLLDWFMGAVLTVVRFLNWGF